MKMKNDLAQYDFEIKYKKGSLNTNADALSRMYVVLCSDEVEKEKLMKECHDSTLAGHRSPETTIKKNK